MIKYNLPVYYDKLNTGERRAVREQYTKEQKNLCLHCKESLASWPSPSITNKSIAWEAFPVNFLKYRVHLHHSHDTGLTIGAVHSYCNAVLWQYHGI